MYSANVSRNMIVNRSAPPFDNPDLRRAMSLSIDRKAFNDIINEGQGEIGAVMQPPPDGLWGMPPEMLADAAGVRPRRRKEPRRSPQDHGKARLWAGQAARGHGVDAQHRALPRPGGDPDRPVEGNLYRRRARHLDTTQWYPQADAQGLHGRAQCHRDGGRRSRPAFYENYVCGAERNYTGYCNPEVDKLVDQQSAESDNEKRKQLVWEIEKRLAEDGARPIIFYPRQATCRHPQVKGMTMMVNSIYNGWRFEDLWLDH